jgi:hypothetical protein
MFNFLIVMYVPFSVFCVLLVCKCVLFCCHRVSTQLHLNISYHISYQVVLHFSAPEVEGRLVVLTWIHSKSKDFCVEETVKVIRDVGTYKTVVCREYGNGN